LQCGPVVEKRYTSTLCGRRRQPGGGTLTCTRAAAGTCAASPRRTPPAGAGTRRGAPGRPQGDARGPRRQRHHGGRPPGRGQCFWSWFSSYCSPKPQNPISIDNLRYMKLFLINKRIISEDRTVNNKVTVI
jgi:hypothetical protein